MRSLALTKARMWLGVARMADAMTRRGRFLGVVSATRTRRALLQAREWGRQ